MRDIDLIERAARAAGLPWDQWVEHGDESWNPLDRDEDAMYLLAYFRMSLAYYDRNAPPELRLPARCAVVRKDDRWWAEVPRMFTTEAPQKAMRRAITRAAAEQQ